MGYALDNDGDPYNMSYFGDDLATLNLVDVVNDNYYNMQDLEEGTYYWNVNAFDDLVEIPYLLHGCFLL